MLRAIFVLLALTACGKDLKTTSTQLDANACPTQNWGAAVNSIIFSSDNSLSVMNGWCNSSGTYTCDPSSGAMTFKITGQDSGTAFDSECLAKGTYSCSYVMASGRSAVSVNCSGSNKLNPTKTYASEKWNQ